MTKLYLCLSALPVTFKQKLKNLQVGEGHDITLYCEISKAGVPVEWSLGGDLLENGEKYQIKQRSSALELIIRDAEPEDSGVYTCVCREQKTKATVKVIGMFNVCNEVCGYLRVNDLAFFCFTCINSICVWFNSCSRHI